MFQADYEAQSRYFRLASNYTFSYKLYLLKLNQQYFYRLGFLLLCLLSVDSPSRGSDETSRILFSRLSEAEGFDADRVAAVLDDQSGMTWLATNSGLIRFDGAGTLKFVHDDSDPASLSSNRLTSAVFDPEGSLWIGTADAGLNRFNPLTLKSRRVVRKPLKGAGNSSEKITCLGISDGGILWIGTSHGLEMFETGTGIYRVPSGIPSAAHLTEIFVRSKKDSIWAGTKSGELFHRKPNAAEFELVWSAGVPISAIAGSGSENEMWIGTLGKGVHLLNTESGLVSPSPLPSRDITSILADTNGDVWVGTSEGLGHFERLTSKFRLHRNNPQTATSLSTNRVTCLFESRMNVLWVGTDGGGVSRFPLNHSWFPHFRSQPGNPGVARLPHDSVWSLAPSADGTLWIGTELGLTGWNPKNGHYLAPNLAPEYGKLYFTTVLETSDGNLWTGTKGNGLIVLPGGDAQQAMQFSHQNDDPQSIGHDFISTLFEDSKSSLWIGTSGAGLWKYRKSARNFLPVPVAMDEDSQLSEEVARFVSAVAEDRSGRLWVAATDGLFLVDSAGSVMRRHQQAIPGAKSLYDYPLTSIIRGKHGKILVGTLNRGLVEIDPVTGEVKSYNQMNSELPSDHILGLVADRTEVVWISTPEGVARFDHEKGKFRDFDDLDGLQNGTLHQNSCALGADGNLYFGGSQGFNRIDPASLPPVRHPPNPILTGFERFGEPVIPEKGGILEKSIAATPEVRLPYSSKDRIAFRFANLNPEFPFRGKFRYRLLGYEEDWRLANRDRRASYSGLDPGSYEFAVQNSPDGRKWNLNQATVKLSILPPWWETVLARAAFLITGLAVIFVTFLLLRRAQIKQMERREVKLRAERDRAEAQVAIQLQNAMLLERVSHSTKKDAGEGDVFAEPMKNLAEHFGVSRCVLCRLQKKSDGLFQLEVIGEHRSNGQSSTLNRAIPVEDPFVCSILRSEEPVQHNNFFAMRTTSQGMPNGAVLLEKADPTNSLSPDQAGLLKSIAIQFGVANAQSNLSELEESYRKELENARREAEFANKAKSEFLAKMTHDLRTPLSAIIGFTQLFKEDESLKDGQRNLVNIIDDSGNHLLDVINEILDVSKIEAGKAEVNPETFELLPFLTSIQEVLKGKVESRGLTFELETFEGLPLWVETDRCKLRQILVNLLGNAIKFTDSGTIELKVAACVSSMASGSGNQGRQIKLAFQVKDTGQGIAEEDLPKLFKEFSQTDSGRYAADSTGLGLSIARAFVNLLGGDIVVRSELGRGTTFEFYVMCEEVPVSNQIDGVRRDRASVITGLAEPFRNTRILIVDDRSLNRLLLSKVLSRVGFDLVEAVNGVDACDKWRETQPDLILMDQNMPVMNGTEAARAIFKECKPGQGPVIIALTANAFEQAREAAIAAGFHDFIAKPFKSEELLAMIAEHLGITYTYKET